MTFSSERQAIQFLERRGYKLERGIITAPKKDIVGNPYEPSESESDAITFLCDEHDYSF